MESNRLLRIILGWTTVTMLFVWLPLIRGLMDGSDYEWGKSYFGWMAHGTGTGGDYWLVVLEGLLGLAILGLGWRGARSPFGVLLLTWHGALAAVACYASYTNPEQYRFQGDTMGIDISLAWAGPLLFGGFFLLAAIWVALNARHSKRTTVPPWNRVNTAWLAILTIMLPCQFLLLRFGPTHGLTDKMGVILTVAQCLLLARIFKPTAGALKSMFRNPHVDLMQQPDF